MSKEFYKETQNIFGETKPKRPLAVSYHNVGDLLRAATEEFRNDKNDHYGARSGANDYDAEKLGILATSSSPRLGEHAKYLGALYQKDFRVYTTTDLKEVTRTLKPGEPKLLIVPYFNSQNVGEKAQSVGAETWGLPPDLVEALKNKVSFHKLVQESGVEGLEVPEHKMSDKDDYVRDSLDLLNYSKQLYQKHGMQNRYPLGVMIRLEESDGNYGSSLVRQEADGRISITPDGDSEKRIYRQTWNDAISASRDLIYSDKQVDPQQEPRVIISRYLDLVDSPGMSVVFLEGQYYSLGWNGQLQLHGSMACVGTSSYNPKEGSLQEAAKNAYEAQSAEAFATFVTQTARQLGIPPESLTGIANVDVMIYGELEAELRRKTGKKPGFYVAECNPRWTNYTDAVMAGIGATGRKPTVSNMLTVIEEGVYTEDKIDLYGANPETIRDIVLPEDPRETTDKAIVRMPDEQMGATYLGNKDRARSIMEEAIDRAKP